MVQVCVAAGCALHMCCCRLAMLHQVQVLQAVVCMLCGSCQARSSPDRPRPPDHPPPWLSSAVSNASSSADFRVREAIRARAAADTTGYDNPEFQAWLRQEHAAPPLAQTAVSNTAAAEAAEAAAYAEAAASAATSASASSCNRHYQAEQPDPPQVQHYYAPPPPAKRRTVAGRRVHEDVKEPTFSTGGKIGGYKLWVGDIPADTNIDDLSQHWVQREWDLVHCELHAGTGWSGMQYAVFTFKDATGCMDAAHAFTSWRFADDRWLKPKFVCHW